MDYWLFIILIIGILIGAVFATLVLLYYLAGQREVEIKKLQQKLSAKLTRECYQEKKELARKNEIESNQVKLELERSVKGSVKQTEQIRANNKEIETLNYRIRDAEYALNQAKEEHVKLQAAYQKLTADYRKQQGRLDLAEARVNEAQNCLDELAQKTEENTKIKEKLLIVVNQFRDTTNVNKQYEKRLAYKTETPLGEVGLGFKDIDGMEPVHVIRLFDYGVHSPAEMRERSPQEIASITGVSYGLATSWINKSYSS